MVNTHFVFLPLFGACFKGYYWPLLFSLGMKSSLNVTTLESALIVFVYNYIKNVTAYLFIYGN